MSKKLDWGRGPWAAEQRTVRSVQRVEEAPGLPALEDVFNQKVRQRYNLMAQLRAPRGVWLVRGVLIGIALLWWVLAILVK